MKLETDLIKQILTALEEDNCDFGKFGHTDEQITYHIRIMKEAGLVNIDVGVNGDLVMPRNNKLTYEGHLHLEALRSGSFLTKIGKTISMETLKQLPALAIKAIQDLA